MDNTIHNHLTALKKTKPLILNVTNYVTMDFMANTLLAIGAAPLMSCSEDEVAELVNISSVININIGTLNSNFVNLALQAAKKAKTDNKAIILDPVGAGASKIRTEAALQLAEYSTVIKGNASEIISLGSTISESKGVESMHTTDQAKEIADQLSKKYSCITVVSGESDYVTDGTQNTTLTHGNAIMSYITGMGCALGGIIGAFVAIENDTFKACCSALKCYGICGEIAANNSTGPASFRTSFIDTLYNNMQSEIQ